MVDRPHLGRALSYFGSKYATAFMYPRPRHEVIVEPFAGGAGYSLRYWRRRVVLVERSPDVCGAWRVLLERGPDAVRGLPLLEPDDDLRDMDLDDDAKRLIGFWVNSGTAKPCNKLCSWALDGQPDRATAFWGPRVRERLARLSAAIQGRWTIIEGDYASAPDEEATWFVDPPYQGDLGDHYWGKNTLDYAQLAAWCQSRKGQVIVCERTGADWLPFDHAGTVKATPGARRKGTADEAVWTNTGEHPVRQLDLWGNQEHEP